MIFDFLNFGLLFVILAIFGFVVKDIINLSQYWNFPDDYKSDTEKFFNYVATALLIIAFTTVLLSPFIASKEPNFANQFLNITTRSIDQLHDNRLISNETYSGIVEGFSLTLISTLFFSYLYIIIYGIAFFFGIFLRFSKAYGISVVLKSKPDTPETYRELIRESDQFFFFEMDSAFNSWAAIRKEDVLRMEIIDLPSRSTKFFKFIGDAIFARLPKQYSYLNTPITFFLIFFVLIGLVVIGKDILAGAICFTGALILIYPLYKLKNRKIS